MVPSHDSGDTLTLHCPAKVNLTLSVGAPDASGYHPIASWMVAVTFSDTLTLQRIAPACQANESRFDIRFADDAPLPAAIDWPLDKDLACRAHERLAQAVGRTLPVALTLEKRIPTGAGLGGGSSDAAGVLVGLNELFDLGLSDDTLREHAAALGSDVAFLVAAMRGMPSATAAGRGERLSLVRLAQPIHLVLVLPELTCATGAVYSAFDRMMSEGLIADEAADEVKVRELARSGSVMDSELFNDLAEPACEVCPELRDARQCITDAIGQHVHITGSGAAMFLLAPDTHEAHTLAQRITRHTGLTAVPTRTLPT